MFGIKLNDIISLNFWFSLNPRPITYKFQLILTWLFGGALVLALIFRTLIIIQKKRIILVKLWRKFYRLWLVMGLLGFLLLFFFYEEIPILGAHFWFLVWLLIVIAWLVYILIYLVFVIPRIRKQLEERKQFEKYLPGSK